MMLWPMGTKIRSQRTGCTGVIAGFTVVQIRGCAPRAAYVMQLDTPINLSVLIEPHNKPPYNPTMLTMLSDAEFTERIDG